MGEDDFAHARYGNGHHGDGGGSTFAINYDDADSDDGVGADDAEAESPGGIGGGGGAGGGDKVRKKKSKPWKVYRRAGGGSMHEANLYRRYRPDFRELAREYPGESSTGAEDDPPPAVALSGSVDCPDALGRLRRHTTTLLGEAQPCTNGSIYHSIAV